LRFLGFLKTEKKNLLRQMRPHDRLIRAISARSRRERADMARIRLGASEVLTLYINDPRNGISALPQETYHDCYTSRVS